jgi:TP901 family phage tail tape measure protein
MANKKLSAVIAIGGTVTSDFRTAVEQTKSKFREVGSALREVERSQRSLNSEIKKAEKAGTDASKYRAELGQLITKTNELKRAQESLLAVEKKITDNRNRQDELRGKIRDTAVAGAAIALPVGFAFTAASKFNYDLQVIGNTADMTRGQVVAMGVEILRLGDRTGQSAETMKNALGYLVAAGQDIKLAQRSMETIGRTSTATAANIEDVARASFVLNDALKISPENLQVALDALVKAGQEGNFEFAEMAKQLPSLGASFQALKFTGQDAVASMGAYLQLSMKGAATQSEAANNMANFLGKILMPETLAKAKKLGSDLNAVVTGAQAKGANPIEAAIKEIERITKGGDQKLLGELFADSEVQKFLRPVLQNMKEYERIRNSALKADGVTNRDFAVMMETSKQQTASFGNALQSLQIVIGGVYETVIGKLAAAFTPFVIAAREFVMANPKLVGGVMAAAGAFTVLRLAVLGTRLAFAVLGGKMLQTTAQLAAARASALLAGGSLATVATAVRTVGLALTATPIGAAIAAIGVGALVIRKYWEPIAAWFGGVIDGLAAGMQPVVQVFREFYDSLGVLKPVIDFIGEGISTVITWFGSLLEPVKSSAAELGEAGKKGRSFGEALAFGIELALKPLTLLIEGITWINNNIGAALAKVSEFGSAASNATAGAYQKVKNFFGSDDATAPTAPAGASVPTLPAMATAPGKGTAVTDNSQTTIQVYQQPGQSTRQLAEEITKYQEQQRAVRQRSLLYDGAPQN